jgi:phage/plasmid-like protein (TIGR03299 family)
MSHEVETMAYTNEVPWHGLGTYIAEAPDVDTMIKQAGLDWEVHKQPIYHADPLTTEYREIERFYALVRDTDRKVFDIAGEVYTPCQNREAFEFFVDFIEDGDATLETAGSLRGGLHVWGLANLKAGFKLAGGDQVDGYLLVVCPHEVGKSLIFKFTPVRVVCQNTLSLALGQGGHGEFRMPHRSKFDEAAIKNAREALGVARESVAQLEKNARLLKKMKLNDDDFITKILMPLFMPKAEISDYVQEGREMLTPRIQTIMDVHKKAPGADPGTGWGALNAVTYFADHIASRTADKRLTNAWLGKTAMQKNKAFASLMELAE